MILTKFALAVQHQYIGTGPIWLNGPNVDLHRCSVREKTIEELQEALDSKNLGALGKSWSKLVICVGGLSESLKDIVQ